MPDSQQTHSDDLAEILSELPRWLDGLSQFMKISKSHRERATVRDDLLVSKLARGTSRLKAKLELYNESKNAALKKNNNELR